MERPIGYWLKHLDQLIEDAFGSVLAEQALSRRDWQVLNTLAGAPRDERELTEALRPFWDEGAPTLDNVTDGLLRRGWIACDAAGRYALTPDGQAARAGVARHVETIRTRMADGITESTYQTTVGVLRRMAENLATPGTPRGDGQDSQAPTAGKTESLAALQLTHVPYTKVGMLIRRPPAEVFQAFVDPAITTKFWFTKSSGKMMPGVVLQWDWEMYGVSGKVRVKEVEDMRRIRFEWVEDKPTTVELRFVPWREDATYVQITETGFSGDGDELVSRVTDSTGGYYQVLCALKALLEHNVVLTVVLDNNPPEGLEL